MGEQDGLSRGFCLDTLHGCSNTSHSTKGEEFLSHA